MIRNDIQGVERAPESIATYLLRKGGKNLYGEPIFRLVWSPNRVMQRGGKFNDWDQNVASHERGGMVRLHSGLLVPNGHKPIRSVIEVRTVRKYAFDAGWVLERWIPATYYGGKGDWEMRCVPGTTVPLSGPYPAHGDYEMCHNTASAELPTISQLQNAIDRCEKARNEHREDTEQVLLERENEALFQYEETCRKEREESEAIIRDLMKPYYGSSLGMGAHRSRLVERLGIREHVGN